jgi:hypothetical protein
MNNDFNTQTIGSGWTSNSTPTFTNPCQCANIFNATSVYDGTPYLWIGSASSFPRNLTTVPYSVNSYTHICFDFIMSTQGDASPCEGPDEMDEGVSLQYSINGGISWTDITYFCPDGNQYPSNSWIGLSDVGWTGFNTFNTWGNYCYNVPAAASATTQFQWHQDQVTSASNDHWGIDNVVLFENTSTNSQQSYSWFDNGTLFSNNQIPGSYELSLGLHEIIVSFYDSSTFYYDTAFVNVVNLPIIELGNDSTVCGNQQVNLSVPSGYSSYNWSNGNFSTNCVVDSSGVGLGSKIIYLTITNSSGCSSIDSIKITFDNCTQIISSELENDFTIYPNPANNIITIDLENNYYEKSNIIISDINGKIFRNIKNSNNKLIINIEDFPQGVYFVILINNNLVIRKKLIIH